MRVPRFSPQAGVAVGVILFVLAMLAVVATAYTASGNFTGSTITPERIGRELRAQADLIRTKINECYMNFKDIDHSGVSHLNDTNFPASSGTGTLVESLECPTYGTGTKNLWTGQSSVMLPPPPKGLEKWVYRNAGAIEGRCIRIQPEAANASDNAFKQGMAEAAMAFSDLERTYSSPSPSQRLILWITRPSGTAHADCAP